jgi:hypothetical protein
MGQLGPTHGEACLQGVSWADVCYCLHNILLDSYQYSRYDQQYQLPRRPV